MKEDMMICKNSNNQLRNYFKTLNKIFFKIVNLICCGFWLWLHFVCNFETSLCLCKLVVDISPYF